MKTELGFSPCQRVSGLKYSARGEFRAEKSQGLKSQDFVEP
jgi:hypothetical protein